MIHYPKNEALEVNRDGCEGEDPVVVGTSGDSPYTLYAVPRWNKEQCIVERHYEVYNSETGVVEHRSRANMVTAASVFESLVKLYQDLQKHGTVEEFNKAEAEDEPEQQYAGPTLQ